MPSQLSTLPSLKHNHNFYKIIPTFPSAIIQKYTNWAFFRLRASLALLAPCHAAALPGWWRQGIRRHEGRTARHDAAPLRLTHALLAREVRGISTRTPTWWSS